MMKPSETMRWRAIDTDAGPNKTDLPVASDRILSIPPAGGQDSVRRIALSDGGNALTGDMG